MLRGSRSVEHTVENFILLHAVRVPVATESNNDKAFFLTHDSLVDVPSSNEMWECNGTHLEFAGVEVELFTERG